MPTRRESFIGTLSRVMCWSREFDGKPVPKVIDFGVAKAAGPRLTANTVFTELGFDRRNRGVHEPRAGGVESAGR